MKANELRIGNYFEDIEGRLCRVDVISRDKEDTRITAIQGGLTFLPVKPIPLTEEWLLKFGFIDNDWAFINNGLELSWSIRRCESGERSCFYLSDKFPEDFQIRVEYVHTLQNLYFALTGEELTIEE